MKQADDFEVTYIYIEPKTLEEKAEQERRLDAVYDLIFDNVSSGKPFR